MEASNILLAVIFAALAALTTVLLYRILKPRPKNGYYRRDMETGKREYSMDGKTWFHPPSAPDEDPVPVAPAGADSIKVLSEAYRKAVDDFHREVAKREGRK